MISNKKTYFLLFLIIFIVFVNYLISFDKGHNWGDDFAAYIDQARSIVEGDYKELLSVNKFRFEHSNIKGLGPIFYPWGFPLLLSPVYYAFGLDILIMKIYVSLYFLLSLIIIFHLFKDNLKNFECLLLVSTIAFNTWFFNLKENLISDIPFIFFTLFSLFLIKKIIIKKDIWLNKYVSFFLIGLCISMSFNIRSIGILLLPTLLFTQYIEERRYSKGIKNIIFDRFNIIPYLVFLLFNILMILSLPRGGSGYFDDLSITNTTTIIKNIIYYIALPSRFFPFLHLNVSYSYFDFNKFSLLFYSSMLILVIFGAILRFKKDYLFIFYLLINLTILIFWPHRQGFRFIMHIFPFFLYFLFIGLSRTKLWINISEKLKPLKVNIAILFGAGLVLLSVAYFSYDTYQKIIFNRINVVEGPYSPDSIELFSYVKKNTTEDDTIIFLKPRALHLFTGRRSFAVNRLISTPDNVLNSSASYIVFNKKPYHPADLLIEDFQGNLQCEFENNTFILCDLRKNSNH